MAPEPFHYNNAGARHWVQTIESKAVGLAVRTRKRNREMAVRENSASRLYKFVLKMLAQPKTGPTSQALFRAFGFNETPSSQRTQSALLMLILNLLYVELDSLISQLKAHGYTDQSFAPVVQVFESRLILNAVFGSWESNHAAFSTAAPLLLVFAESLPNDGEAASQEDLTELSSEISELRSSVLASDLPENVKRFVLAQLDIIERAVRDYPIAGTKAFKKAVEEGVFHDISHAEEVAEYEAAPQMTALKKIQNRAVRAAKFTVEFGKFLAGCETIFRSGEHVADFAPHISGWLQRIHLLR
jgi:hypothetical protein